MRVRISVLISEEDTPARKYSVQMKRLWMWLYLVDAGIHNHTFKEISSWWKQINHFSRKNATLGERYKVRIEAAFRSVFYFNPPRFISYLPSTNESCIHHWTVWFSRAASWIPSSSIRRASQWISRSCIDDANEYSSSRRHQSVCLLPKMLLKVLLDHELVWLPLSFALHLLLIPFRLASLVLYKTY